MAVQGGAVRTQNTTTVSVADSIFENNNATNGGGIYFNNCTQSSVTDTFMNYKSSLKDFSKAPKNLTKVIGKSVGDKRG